MRIAVVEFVGKGGILHYTYQLCRGMAANGADVTLVTDRQYELEALEHPFELVKLFRLWDPKPPGEISRSRTARAVRKLRRVARAARYYREWIRLLRYLRRERFDVVQFGDIRFPGDVLCLRAMRLAGLRLADVCHNIHPFAVAGRASGRFRKSRLDRFLYKRIYGQFERVFVHFEVNRSAFLEEFGLDPARVSCIPHGNEEIFAQLRDPSFEPDQLRHELGIPPDVAVVLFFGTLAPYKGIDLLIEAFADVRERHSAARLVIAGFPSAGFDLDEHHALARRLGVARDVHFVPRYLATEEIAAWMELAAVAVFPYRTIFQSGALHVAHTFGVPIVATRVGAMPEVVSDGETGLLAPPGDAGAIADAVSQILENPVLARRLGEAAAADAHSRFDWRRIGRMVLEEYEKLPGTGSRPTGASTSSFRQSA